MADVDVKWTWPHRFERLVEVISDPHTRKELWDFWTKTSAPGTEYTTQRPTHEWQITIGRALLDYPELDRTSILKRVRELEANPP